MNYFEITIEIYKLSDEELISLYNFIIKKNRMNRDKQSALYGKAINITEKYSYDDIKLAKNIIAFSLIRRSSFLSKLSFLEFQIRFVRNINDSLFYTILIVNQIISYGLVNDLIEVDKIEYFYDFLKKYERLDVEVEKQKIIDKNLGDDFYS